MRLFSSLAIAAVLSLSGVAFAQEAIPTAAGAPENGAPIPASSPKPLSIDDNRDRFDDGPRPVNRCGAPAHDDGSPDRSVHGQVFAGVGTRGYREAGGVACIPLGDKAAATLAVDVGQYGRRH